MHEEEYRTDRYTDTDRRAKRITTAVFADSNKKDKAMNRRISVVFKNYSPVSFSQS